MEKARDELIGEFHNKMVTTAVRELSPIGVRMEVNMEGEIKGRLNARSLDTSNVLFKTDGSYEYETKSVATTMEGDTVVLWGSGTGRSTGPMTASLEGEVHYMTQSPRLNWLNNTTARTEGTVDRVSREIQGRVYKK